METVDEVTHWTLLYFASEWLVRLAMLVVVPLRRSPEAAKGWLLLILFLPWPGLLLYLLIGRPRLPRWRRARFAQLPALLGMVRERLGSQLSGRRLEPEQAQLVPAARLVSQLAHFTPLGGNAVELLSDYDGTLRRLVADIDAARDHIHLLFYIMADDAGGGPVIAALARACRRGLRCRVLVDAVGASDYLRPLLARLRAVGVEAQSVLPVHWLILNAPRMDLRNHRKLAVIDGRIAYTGSQNLVSAGFKPGLIYEDLMVRVRGPLVLQLQAVFLADWYLETGQILDAPRLLPVPEECGPVVAQALPSGPDYPNQNNQRLLVTLLHQARSRVIITTPYFVPDEALLQALQTAVLRGVEVHLVVAAQIDQWLVGFAQRSYYEELLELGVRIYHYRERFLHAKHMSWDDTLALIGSSNIDIRSFVLNAEISVVFYDAGVTAVLRREQERYLELAEELELERWRRRPLYLQILQNLARLLSPLL
ncbi:MAG TPA: cardiolipin synthase [Candidatus Competibacteraceae bacterium]|nr:cardiolipin synthase [Candidatus Competibacteraceae bacterium]